MITEDEYLNLITSEHRDKPKFTAMVALDVSPLVRIQNLLESLIPGYDLDLAIGAQLDVIGKWAGVSRNIAVPVTGVFFSWDDDASLGWDYGIWFNENDPGSIVSLPDDVYRTLIRAKIAANNWDGTVEGAYAIWEIMFPDLFILIQDHQNMTMAFILVGHTVDSLTLALLTGGYIPLKPEGVLVSSYVVPANDGPLFAWDTESDFLQGWDVGSWGIELRPT